MNNLPNNPQINPENLKPFRKFCMTIGALPSSYVESLTYQELLLWFCDYLQNTVIPTVNNNAEAVEELQNLYIELKDYVDKYSNDLTNYVNNYFDNLDIQNEVDKKIDELFADGSIESLLVKYNRIFKPQLHYSVNWAGISNGQDYTAPINSRENILIEMKNAYFDGFILPIQTKWNSSSGHYEIINDLETDLEYALKSAENNVPLHALKIHHANYDTSKILENSALFINDMQNIIDTLYETFKNVNSIEYLTVLNELTSLFVDNNNNSLIISLINYAKSKGYKSGITSAGSNYFNRISDEILNASDILATNEYVRIGSKREETTYSDSLIAWENAPFNSLYQNYAGKFRDKKFIISETGCKNNWEALQNPSGYNFTSEQPPNSEAQNTYLYGMFNKCQLIDEVWLWFEIPENKTLFKNYLRRFDTYESIQ